jgi:cob(I)alamin adenosyltransferase
MKIYTRTGDGGSTALFGGQRVSKHDPRPEAYGTLDELNVELGALLALFSDEIPVVLELRRIQNRLFVIGARLAAVPGTPEFATLDVIAIEECEWMEASIDRMESETGPMAGFILPAGHPSAIQAHRARTICRRAERRVVALAEHDVNDAGSHHVQMEMMYLNRLADYLFALARFCNHMHGIEDVLWHR